MEHTKLKAEKFLREKLQAQIESFGDGFDEFNTREIEHLLRCLDEKNEANKQLVDALEGMVDTFKQFRDHSNRCGDALNDAEELLNNLK